MPQDQMDEQRIRTANARLDVFRLQRLAHALCCLRPCPKGQDPVCRLCGRAWRHLFINVSSNRHNTFSCVKSLEPAFRMQVGVHIARSEQHSLNHRFDKPVCSSRLAPLFRIKPHHSLFPVSPNWPQARCLTVVCSVKTYADVVDFDTRVRAWLYAKSAP